ncbi:Prephenate dehydratase [Microthyrium microscopicum]|uniref:Prephenate dehydratase n=1 Tax=Microthyrium microscopicum TaxID=703497 RepID=A0A6A6UCY5_9PEZI|nr:Prephenate dehydratase [Microthyrium microscopicum]
MVSEISEQLVGYLGPEGSFTQQAALQLFPAHQQGVRLVPISDIPLLFDQVATNAVQISIVPIRNSTNGYVQPTIDQLNKQSGSNKLIICGETSVKVSHCLAGKRKEETQQNPPTSKEYNFQHIKTLKTHPQAWTQCQRFLEQALPHTERQQADSTSQAAFEVSQDSLGISAAICSELAAKRWGLDILANNIQDDPDNETYFVVIRQRHGKVLVEPVGAVPLTESTSLLPVDLLTPNKLLDSS